MKAADLLSDEKLRREAIRAIREQVAIVVGSETSQRIVDRAEQTVTLLLIAEADGDQDAAVRLRQTMALDKDLVAIRASKAVSALALDILGVVVGALGRGIAVALKGVAP